MSCPLPQNRKKYLERYLKKVRESIAAYLRPTHLSQPDYWYARAESWSDHLVQYLEMLRKEGAKDWVFQECRDLNAMQFRLGFLLINVDGSWPGSYIHYTYIIQIAQCLNNRIEPTYISGCKQILASHFLIFDNLEEILVLLNLLRNLIWLLLHTKCGVFEISWKTLKTVKVIIIHVMATFFLYTLRIIITVFPVQINM